MDFFKPVFQELSLCKKNSGSKCFAINTSQPKKFVSNSDRDIITPQRKSIEPDKDQIWIGGQKENFEKMLLNSLQPTQNGSDYYSSIMTMANEMIDQKSHTKNKSTNSNSASTNQYNIYVLGSGLSDTGELNFLSIDLLDSTNPLEGLYMKNFLSKIQRNEDYSNITIHFYGLGKVVSPQESLDFENIKKVKNIYESVFTQLGFKVEDDDDEFEHSSSSVTTSYVVKSISHRLKTYPYVAQFYPHTSNPKNQTEMIEESNSLAKNTIIPVINNVKQIIVYGVTDSEKINRSLSLQRANVARIQLIKAGVDGTLISCKPKAWSGGEKSKNRTILVKIIYKNS